WQGLYLWTLAYPQTPIRVNVSCMKGPPTLQLYALSLHDALPICALAPTLRFANPLGRWRAAGVALAAVVGGALAGDTPATERVRSEEHTSELQSLRHLVCRLLLEKKKTWK